MRGSEPYKAGPRSCELHGLTGSRAFSNLCNDGSEETTVQSPQPGQGGRQVVSSNLDLKPAIARSAPVSFLSPQISLLKPISQINSSQIHTKQASASDLPTSRITLIKILPVPTPVEDTTSNQILPIQPKASETPSQITSSQILTKQAPTSDTPKLQMPTSQILIKQVPASDRSESQVSSDQILAKIAPAPDTPMPTPMQQLQDKSADTKDASRSLTNKPIQIPFRLIQRPKDLSQFIPTYVAITSLPRVRGSPERIILRLVPTSIFGPLLDTLTNIDPQNDKSIYFEYLHHRNSPIAALFNILGLQHVNGYNLDNSFNSFIRNDDPHLTPSGPKLQGHRTTAPPLVTQNEIFRGYPQPKLGGSDFIKRLPSNLGLLDVPANQLQGNQMQWPVVSGRLYSNTEPQSSHVPNEYANIPQIQASPHKPQDHMLNIPNRPQWLTTYTPQDYIEKISYGDNMNAIPQQYRPQVNNAGFLPMGSLGPFFNTYPSKNNPSAGTRSFTSVPTNPLLESARAIKVENVGKNAPTDDPDEPEAPFNLLVNPIGLINPGEPSTNSPPGEQMMAGSRSTPNAYEQFNSEAFPFATNNIPGHPPWSPHYSEPNYPGYSQMIPQQHPKMYLHGMRNFPYHQEGVQQHPGYHVERNLPNGPQGYNPAGSLGSEQIPSGVPGTQSIITDSIPTNIGIQTLPPPYSDPHQANATPDAVDANNQNAGRSPHNLQNLPNIQNDYRGSAGTNLPHMPGQAYLSNQPVRPDVSQFNFFSPISDPSTALQYQPSQTFASPEEQENVMPNTYMPNAVVPLTRDPLAFLNGQMVPTQPVHFPMNNELDNVGSKNPFRNVQQWQPSPLNGNPQQSASRANPGVANQEARPQGPREGVNSLNEMQDSPLFKSEVITQGSRDSLPHSSFQSNPPHQDYLQGHPTLWKQQSPLTFGAPYVSDYSPAEGLNPAGGLLTPFYTSRKEPGHSDIHPTLAGYALSGKNEIQPGIHNVIQGTGWNQAPLQHSQDYGQGPLRFEDNGHFQPRLSALGSQDLLLPKQQTPNTYQYTEDPQHQQMFPFSDSNQPQMVLSEEARPMNPANELQNPTYQQPSLLVLQNNNQQSPQGGGAVGQSGDWYRPLHKTWPHDSKSATFSYEEPKYGTGFNAADVDTQPIFHYTESDPNVNSNIMSGLNDLPQWQIATQDPRIKAKILSGSTPHEVILELMKLLPQTLSGQQGIQPMTLGTQGPQIDNQADHPDGSPLPVLDSIKLILPHLLQIIVNSISKEGHIPHLILSPGNATHPWILHPINEHYVPQIMNNKLPEVRPEETGLSNINQLVSQSTGFRGFGWNSGARVLNIEPLSGSTQTLLRPSASVLDDEHLTPGTKLGASAYTVNQHRPGEAQIQTKEAESQPPLQMMASRTVQTQDHQRPMVNNTSELKSQFNGADGKIEMKSGEDKPVKLTLFSSTSEPHHQAALDPTVLIPAAQHNVQPIPQAVNSGRVQFQPHAQNTGHGGLPATTASNQGDPAPTASQNVTNPNVLQADPSTGQGLLRMAQRNVGESSGVSADFPSNQNSLLILNPAFNKSHLGESKTSNVMADFKGDIFLLQKAPTGNINNTNDGQPINQVAIGPPKSNQPPSLAVPTLFQHNQQKSLQTRNPDMQNDRSQNVSQPPYQEQWKRISIIPLINSSHPVAARAEQMLTNGLQPSGKDETQHSSMAGHKELLNNKSQPATEPNQTQNPPHHSLFHYYKGRNVTGPSLSVASNNVSTGQSGLSRSDQTLNLSNVEPVHVASNDQLEPLSPRTVRSSTHLSPNELIAGSRQSQFLTVDGEPLSGSRIAGEEMNGIFHPVGQSFESLTNLGGLKEWKMMMAQPGAESQQAEQMLVPGAKAMQFVQLFKPGQAERQNTQDTVTSNMQGLRLVSTLNQNTGQIVNNPGAIAYRLESVAQPAAPAPLQQMRLMTVRNAPQRFIKVQMMQPASVQPVWAVQVPRPTTYQLQPQVIVG